MLLFWTFLALVLLQICLALSRLEHPRFKQEPFNDFDSDGSESFLPGNVIFGKVVPVDTQSTQSHVGGARANHKIFKRARDYDVYSNLGAELATRTVEPIILTDTQMPGGNLTLHGGEEHQRFSDDLLPEQRITDEQKLFKRLFTNYTKHSRPVLKTSSRVTVGLGITITQIFELDEKNQMLITNVWLDQEWFDEYLKWNPLDYNGMKIVRIPSSKLWLPDIVLYNNAADYSSRTIDTRAMVSHNGFVFWPLPTKLYSSCKVNVQYFPFDEQVCHMKFGSWTYDGFKVDLTNRSEGPDLSLYIENGEWTLITVTQRRNVVIYTCCEEPYPDVTFHVYIRRRTLYYLHTVFFPCFIMSVLTLLVFLLPPDSGEKVALGITVMLAFAVFMLSVIEKLPETSEHVPLISIYLSAVMSMTAVSLILTMIVLNMHHKNARSLRLSRLIVALLDFTDKLANCCKNFGRSCSSEKSSSYYDQHASDQSRYAERVAHRYPSLDGAGGYVNIDTADPNRTIVRLNPGDFMRELVVEFENDAVAGLAHQPEHQLTVAIIRIIDRHRQEDDVDDIIRDWRRLAEFIDKILFWLFLIAITSFTVFILELAPTYKLLD